MEAMMGRGGGEHAAASKKADSCGVSGRGGGFEVVEAAVERKRRVGARGSAGRRRRDSMVECGGELS